MPDEMVSTRDRGGQKNRRDVPLQAEHHSPTTGPMIEPMRSMRSMRSA
jgi:hypothetical protein